VELLVPPLPPAATTEVVLKVEFPPAVLAAPPVPTTIGMRLPGLTVRILLAKAPPPPPPPLAPLLVIVLPPPPAPQHWTVIVVTPSGTIKFPELVKETGVVYVVFAYSLPVVPAGSDAAYWRTLTQSIMVEVLATSVTLIDIYLIVAAMVVFLAVASRAAPVE
jgi:hypothetical protein